MKSTDLAVVFGVALVVGAGAGFAASAMSTPEAHDDGTAALEQQIDDLGSELREVRGEWKKSERARDHLADRLARAESRLAQIEGLTERSSTGTPDASSASPEEHAASEDAVVADKLEALKKELEAKVASRMVSKRLSGEWAERAKRMKLAAKLRSMPEEERWDKAQEDLSLSASQIADLKDAMSVRDARIQEGRSVTEAELPNGGKYKMIKLDQEVVKAAQTEYDERLDRVLGRDQKTAWNEKGYENAFGRPRGNVMSLSSGGASTIQITTTGPSEEK